MQGTDGKNRAIWAALLSKLPVLTHICTQGGVTAYLERRLPNLAYYKMPFEYQTHNKKQF